ncbi:MAG: pyridoxal phosphate-dependent aminotransferase [Firmicutes bacterium]|nr:pyridoxal phosphate-dependent aminotransferase [Bacillota bacterium]
MFNQAMLRLGQNRSVIRDIFEYSKLRSAQIGADKVFDFSLGNPSVPPPPQVGEAIARLLREADPLLLHGYSSAQGDARVRQVLADSLQRRFGAQVGPDDLYLTSGAAAALAISLKALCLPGDQVVLLAPFFPEYQVFVEAAGAEAVVVPAERQALQIDFAALESLLSPSTRALIVNSPNNPSGVVLTRPVLERLCLLLLEKQEEYGHPIYLIADEPYRELVFDQEEPPYLPNLYDNAIVCYSYSKSLSLPGERIGYVAVPKTVAGHDELYAAVCGAGRALGYVCAPTLFQQVVAACVDVKPDIAAYRRNRDLLYGGLTEYGFRCVRPDGAFYLFMETPEPDAAAFCEKAKEFELLLVPSDSFGCPGFVRIAFCVSEQRIKDSLPAFKALAQSYGLCK